MAFTQPVQHFWAFVITYMTASVVISGMILYLFGWAAMLVGLMILAGTLLGLSLMGQSLFVPHRVRAWQVQVISTADLHDRFPNLDLSWLEIYGQTLQNTGFVPLQDYTHNFRNSAKVPIKSMVRCFYHQIEGCLAEVGFIFNLQGEVRVSHTVFFSIFEQGWMLIDFNCSPNRRESLMYAWRNPREVRRYYPQFTIEDVLAQHLKTRGEMADSLDTNILPQQTWEMYQEIQRELVARPWKRLRRRNLFAAMWEATQFERYPKYEWLGDYRKLRTAKPPAIKSY